MSDTQKHHYDQNLLFAREYKVFEKYKKIILNKDIITKEELLDEYASLAKHYEKLLKNIGKMTKLGDSNQKKLKQANETIENQNRMLKASNQEIQNKNDELTKAYQKIEIIAKTDSLTKLWNRRAIIELLNQEKKQFEVSGNPFTIILCDIDHFKSVNDNYGHDYGDYLLSSLANLFIRNLREKDEVARWGGEEFLFLLPNTGANTAKILAEELRKKIEVQKFTFNFQSLSITVSFGISVCKELIKLEEYIKQTDICLYEAKRKGRNCVVVYGE